MTSPRSATVKKHTYGPSLQNSPPQYCCTVRGGQKTPQLLDYSNFYTCNSNLDLIKTGQQYEKKSVVTEQRNFISDSTSVILLHLHLWRFMWDSSIFPLMFFISLINGVKLNVWTVPHLWTWKLMDLFALKLIFHVTLFSSIFFQQLMNLYK